MSGLVWDDSRIKEAAELAYTTVINYLESFADGPDGPTTGTIANRVSLLIERDLTRWQNCEDLGVVVYGHLLHEPLQSLERRSVPCGFCGASAAYAYGPGREHSVHCPNFTGDLSKIEADRQVGETEPRTEV